MPVMVESWVMPEPLQTPLSTWVTMPNLIDVGHTVRAYMLL